MAVPRGLIEFVDGVPIPVEKLIGVARQAIPAFSTEPERNALSPTDPGDPATNVGRVAYVENLDGLSVFRAGGIGWTSVSGDRKAIDLDLTSVATGDHALSLAAGKRYSVHGHYWLGGTYGDQIQPYVTAPSGGEWRGIVKRAYVSSTSQVFYGQDSVDYTTFYNSRGVPFPDGRPILRGYLDLSIEGIVTTGTGGNFSVLALSYFGNLISVRGWLTAEEIGNV